MKKLFFAVALSLGVTLGAAQFEADVAHSSVGFKIKHMKVSNVNGKFGDFSASVDFDEAKKRFNALTAVVKVASINTDNERRDAHLRAADFFDANKFGEMTFKMKSAKNGIIKGDLTIKGITREVSLKCDFGGVAQAPNGDKVMGFSLTGNIKRSDFKVGEPSVMIGDEVALNIEIEARGK